MMARPLNEPGRVRGREIRLTAGQRPPVRVALSRPGGRRQPRLLRRRPDGPAVEAAAPDARAVVWDDVAHMVGMEQPERLAATIVEFLAPLERWS